MRVIISAGSRVLNYSAATAHGDHLGEDDSSPASTSSSYPSLDIFISLHTKTGQDPEWYRSMKATDHGAAARPSSGVMH